MLTVRKVGVRNINEKQLVTQDTREEKISEEEFEAPIKVINKIGNSLSSYGINIQVIINEIRYLQIRG